MDVARVEMDGASQLLPSTFQWPPRLLADTLKTHSSIFILFKDQPERESTE